MAAMRDRNHARFLADDDHDRVGLFAQSDGRTMAHACARAETLLLLRQREHTRGGHHAGAEDPVQSLQLKRGGHPRPRRPGKKKPPKTPPPRAARKKREKKNKPPPRAAVSQIPPASTA